VNNQQIQVEEKSSNFKNNYHHHNKLRMERWLTLSALSFWMAKYP